MDLAFGKKFISCIKAGFRFTMVLEGTGWTVANLENLSMQVRKYFLSVE